MALLGFERGEDAAILPIQFKAELDRLFEYAKELGRTGDPDIRERLVKAYEKVEIMKYMGYTQLTKFAKGHAPGPDAAVTKIWWSEYHQDVTELAMEAVGYYAEPFDASTPLDGDNFQPVGPGYANGVAQDAFNTHRS